MPVQPVVFGATGTCAHSVTSQLTLKPLRRCKLHRLILSAGAGDPATVGVDDLLASFSITEVTINGINFQGNSAGPAQAYAANSNMEQPWQGIIVDPSTTITVTFSAANLATLATAAVIAASFQAVGELGV